MSRDGERVIELINELGSRVGNVLTDMVPPSAQVPLLDPLGVLAVFAALVGWGRRVPIQANRISSVRQRVIFELGGPAANLAVAIILGIVLRAWARAGLPVFYDSVVAIAGLVIYAIVFLSLSIFAFQLLPIPGLDGWNIVEAIFRNRNARKIASTMFHPSRPGIGSSWKAKI